MIIDGERLRGTRKGLYFGSVAVIKKENGETLIRDVTFPNIIPQAFYLLTGIDNNDQLIVESRTMEKCSERLGISKDPLPTIEVQSKHFQGKCFLVNLS